ncbi:MAG: NADH-quinone oxidoreductase subunit M [Deltaproteobacteria bacterium]|nr:MAG: NADH-quinone oxidoreductase subunit M [Deltaproteobacteria bacterium]
MEQFLIFDNVSYPILSMLVFVPITGALGLFFINSEYMMKVWGLFVTLLTSVISIPLYTYFNCDSAKYQFAEVYKWFPSIGLDYSLGIDGISILLVILTTFIMPLCILCSWNYIDNRIKEFLFAVLVMESAMIGVFVSLNTVLFYIFWEAMLIPMYLLIAVWGGPRKGYASLKFFLYTLIASIFLLVAIIALYIKTGTFFIPELMGRQFGFGFQIWVFLACAIAFAVKIPMFPLHTWLPAAHVEAPTAGSVILASVLLKMGGYGFIRLCLPVTPLAAQACIPYLIALSIASIIFGGYLALGQNDIKKLIAYSSVGHMGFVTLGIFVLNLQGIKGAILQMINHGITTGALFICIGIIYERTHSRDLKVNSALGLFMPFYVTFLGIFSLSSLAFPGTNSFVGEFLVLLGAFSKNKLIGAMAIPGAVLAAAYMLRMLQKMIWADSDGHRHGDGSERGLFDLDLREKLTLCFLTVFVFWIGLNPEPLLNIMDESVKHLLFQYHEGLKQVIDSSDTLHHALKGIGLNAG